jgi:large repetitive protein
VQTIPANGSVTLPISVFVGTSGATVSAVAGSSTVPESTLANNSDTKSITPNLSDVSTTVALPANAVAGTTVSGTVTYTNNSTTATTFTSVVTINGVPTSTVQTIPANGSVTLPISVFVGTSGATVSAVAGSSTVPESTLANNTAQATIAPSSASASISGRVWLDTDSNRSYTTGTDLDLSGWRVELLNSSGTVVGTATTAADGRYVISGQAPGSGYSVRFKNPSGQIVVSTPFNQASTTPAGNISTGTTTSVMTGAGVVVAGAITGITLYSGDNTINQNLPIDPSGIVYDAITRKPVAGALVTLIGPDGNPVPGANLVQGASTMTTDASGIYQFDLLPTAPKGRYRLSITPPQGYLATPAVQGGVAQPGVAPGTSAANGTISGGVYTPPSGAFIAIQPNATAPTVGVNGANAISTNGTQYFLEFNFPAVGTAGVIHNHIPLDPIGAGAILVTKVGDKSVAEVADSVRYFIRMRNTTNGTITGVKLEDLLPAGFRYILGTARLNSVTLADPAGGVGRALTFDIGSAGAIPANTTWELSYYVRLGAGSQQGDGVNRATAVFPGVGGVPVRSNTAFFKVNVQGGVFSNEGCIIGKVYVDCDGTHTQGNESGSRELGIPGVRLVMLDGTYVVTDNEGKYSVCGMKPQTHVIKVDRTTLPKGSRLLPSSNRNAGVGDSLFVDLKGGELARADFIEGSCSPEVLDQVKARRAQGGVLAPEKEIRPDLKIDNRPLEIQQQILPNTRPATPADGGTNKSGGANQ